MTHPFTAASVAQAGGADVVAITGLRAVFPAAVLNGPAFPCACEPCDNLALHHALRRAPRGAVLVCDAGDDLSGGYFGELMARDACARGIAGLVIHGAVRDTVQISALGFPVFFRGTQPASCVKRAARSVGEPVSFMGARVAAGDWVIADPDGIVFVPADRWEALEARTLALEEREAALVHRLDAGELLADVLDSLPE